MPKWTKRLQKIGKSSSALQPMPRPSPHSSTEELRNQKKSDSTTAKTIAEPYLIESVTFYRTAIVLNWLEKTEHCRSLVVREEFT